jgi:hypothetical protein
MREKRSSSTLQYAGSTADAILAFPQSRAQGARRPIGRAERTFDVFSVLMLILFAVGWSWSIANARVNGARTATTPGTATIADALTDPRAPSTAYLTDALLTKLTTSLSGESGKLRAR